MRHATIAACLFLLVLPFSISKAASSDELSEIQEAVRLAPNDPGNWFDLAKLTDERDLRVQAYVSYLRYLALEPDHARSAAASVRIWELLFQGVEPHKKAKKSKISIDPPEYESDPWWQVSMMMSLNASIRKTAKAAKMSDAEFFATTVEGLSLVLDDLLSDAEVDPFWKVQIVQYFNDAREAGHTATLGYFVRQSAGDGGVVQWVQNNASAVESFREWNHSWTPASD